MRGGWLGCGRDQPCSVSLWLPLHQNSLQSVHCLTTNIRSSTFSKIRNWSLDRSIALFGPGTMCNRLKGHRTPPHLGGYFRMQAARPRDPETAGRWVVKNDTHISTSARPGPLKNFYIFVPECANTPPTRVFPSISFVGIGDFFRPH